jgi:hypothetical protein
MNNKPKHTPGPWSVQDYFDEFTVLAHGNKDRQYVANITKGAEVYFQRQSEANAQLIAAAPELLEAAKELLSFISLDTENRRDAIAALANAIAKAEGSEK